MNRGYGTLGAVDCAVCAIPSALEPLCSQHKRVLATCPDLTPEQIRSRCPDGAAVLGLVDMFGVTHPLPARVRVGRDPDACELSILHASISSLHAELEVVGDMLTITDRGSLNGTFIAGEPIARGTFAVAEMIVRFGAVSFMICPDALTRGALPSARRTVPSGDRTRQIAVLVHGEPWELTIMAESARFAGGRGGVELSLMEGRMLQILLARSPATGFVSSTELVASLGFGTRGADSDNVRELVRRLRRKLGTVALGDLIESRRILGYRIAPWVAPAP